MPESRKPRRTFTPDFKHQLVQLYKNGKRKCDIVKEYNIGYSTLDKWIQQEANSGSFKEKDNLTPEQEELAKLRKQNQQLLMENDILYPKGLVSSYTVVQFKVHKTTCNEAGVANLVDRKFNDRKPLGVVVSDLTYVRVAGQWNYICVLVDLFNREIIGYSAGKNKDANLVSKAFASVKSNLSKISIFHTDRGNEFKNQLIE